MDIFLAGMLAHGPLRDVVLGRRFAGRSAEVAGYEVAQAAGPWSVIVAGDEALTGEVLDGLDAAEVARLDFFLTVLGAERRQVAAEIAGQTRQVWLYASTLARATWDQTDWLARFGATWVVTAAAVMALRGAMPADRIAARLVPMLVWGASAVRAVDAAPTVLRHRAVPDDVKVAEMRQPYAKFFALQEYDVAWRRFDGGMSETVTRAAFVSGDAVTVLPYDPARDRVLVVEQFRAGPWARGDAQSWQIEAIAGRIDPGETPEQAARREAVEEAGLRLDRLVEVGRYYPSPGAVSEYLYSYVALTDLPDGSAGVFGEADEAEDIRGHLISFDRLMDLVASREIENAPLILTALWLQRERSRLRVGIGGEVGSASGRDGPIGPS
ncbi:MAG: NUDIX domain-containing protein [bacterium]